MKTLYLDSIAGIAGDMFTASFLDAGLVSRDEILSIPKQLHLENVQVMINQVNRAAMRATHVDVQYETSDFHHEHHTHISCQDIKLIITNSELADQTKTIAIKMLDILAEAEAVCHGVSKDNVVFHELGMIDSIVDIAMASYCIAKIAVKSVIASPIKFGRGYIKTMHGTLPVPPPVSAVLATNMSIENFPSTIEKDNVELSTPTGLAILKTLNPIFSQEWPSGKLLAQGYGAGTKEFEHYPNLFRIGLLESTEENRLDLPYLTDSVMEINANYDDASPEHLAWISQKLFHYGALDVWQTAATGKKGRVTIILSILVPSDHWKQCVHFILTHTSTFGLRYKKLDRLLLVRHFEKRQQGKDYVQVKLGYDIKGNKIKEKYEYEDIKEIWENATIDD